MTIFRSEIWKNGRFVRLWAAQLISLVGDQIYLIALPWLVYDVTHSGSSMSLSFAFEMLPYLIFSLLGGVLSDKWNRKHVLVLGNVLAVLPLLLVYLLSQYGVLASWHIYLCSFVLSCIVSLILPAFESAIPSLVERAELVHANSLSEVTNSTMTLLGPLLAGILIALVGARYAVLLNAGSFLFAGLLYLFLRFDERSPRSERLTGSVIFSSFKEGFLFVTRHRMIRIGVALSTLNNITVGAYTVILIFHMRQSMGLSAEATGLVMTLSAVSSLLVSAWLAPNLSQKLSKGLTMVGSLALSGFGIVFVGLSSHMAVLILAQGVYMGAITLFTINWRTLRQEVTPKDMIGRVSGVCRGIAFAGASLGGFLGGVTLTYVHHATLLVIEGVIIALVSLTALRSPLVQSHDVAELEYRSL
ncbi:MAG TPA: MFS transporter [Bacilli bacterium]|nr:MFS transporter [Bacilli bacterium]